MKYEFRIETLDDKYVDSMVVCLARQGYAPFITDDGDVCITIRGDELKELQ